MLKFLAKLAVLAFFGVLAGCTADWDPARQGRLNAAAHHPQAPNGAPLSGRTALSAGTRSSQFAALPDRGELAVYDRGAKPRVSGAYNAYPVHLSEEHALKAAHAGGHMIIRAPDGKTIMLAYERHVEHPDGNWTWIGRDAKGADAVITFGEEAAFGTIPQVDEDSLRLTMSGGQTWLVATDRSKLPDTDRALTRSGKEDYLIPPEMAAGAASNKTPMGTGSQAASVAIAPAAATTVDVVLGYTTGLAAALGGDSQAVTRLNNLIEIGNQAYANSGVNATLRLVRTVSVAYADDTDNGATLEDLTGYDDDTDQNTPPHPAFAALRAARDTYGADLVSLVRDFRTPQNHGCGIAWLIGGEQSGIEQSDAPFGYSVVSDGSDIDEGDGQTYFCRDESLVHELGHNMGQAHNIDDSDDTSGVHAYSYGYRETSANGFYTVMAYRLTGSNQFAIRHFANPNISYSGRPTGIANQSDNTLSMNQVLPIIASFRAGATTPGVGAVRNDIDGDGKTDLLWRSDSEQHFAYWIMNGATQGRSLGFALDQVWRVGATGDLTGDGKVDVVWINNTNTYLALWASNGNTFDPILIGAYPPNWRLVGAADIDGDKKADLLWRSDNEQTFGYWIMNGATQVRSLGFALDQAWRVGAVGDLTGDGKADVVWINNTNTYLALWASNGNTFDPILIGAYPPNWRLVGTADIDGDKKSDLLWRSGSDQHFAYWIMNGATQTRSLAFELDQAWRVGTIGDLTGDGRADVVWINNTNTYLALWASNGTTFTPTLIGAYPPNWRLLNF